MMRRYDGDNNTYPLLQTSLLRSQNLASASQGIQLLPWNLWLQCFHSQDFDQHLQLWRKKLLDQLPISNVGQISYYKMPILRKAHSEVWIIYLLYITTYLKEKQLTQTRLNQASLLKQTIRRRNIYIRAMKNSHNIE